MGLAFSCSPSGERGVKYFVEQYMQVFVMLLEHCCFHGRALQWNSAYDAVFIQSRHVRNHLICEFELCSIREAWISEARHVNYRIAVGLLIGQRWEQWRPTLP